MTYHWTTKQNAIEIERIGISKYSFFCQHPQHWHGEVCFEVLETPPKLDIIWHWNNKDKSDWQRINHVLIEPQYLRRLSRQEIWIARIFRKLSIRM